VLGVKISLRANISGTRREGSRPALVRGGQGLHSGSSLRLVIGLLWEDVVQVACYGSGGCFLGGGVAEALLRKRAGEVPGRMW